MSKPEFSKEFNLEHAKAGAPIATAGRGSARLLAHAEEAARHCCVVVVEQAGNIGTRYGSGRVNEVGATDNPFDLVMIPLGMINGRPVFMGDIIKSPDCKPTPATPLMRFGEGSTWCWPAPARVYPETQIDGNELCRYFYGESDSVRDGLIRMTNISLRHAIDSKQVIPADEHKAVVAVLHDKWVAQITEMNGKRAARDMAVARTVEDVYCQLVPCKQKNSNEYLRAIIGDVKP